MSMNLSSPVQMLPQEVKTPAVPDSEMSSTIGSAEYKRKEGPDALDALAAPDAKKRATPDASKNDKDVVEELDRPESDEDESDEESDTTDDEELDIDEKSGLTDEEEGMLDPSLKAGDNVDQIVRYTTPFGDLQGLAKALARIHPDDPELCKKRYNTARGVQLGAEIMARFACEGLDGLSNVKMRVEVVFPKDGHVFGGAACFRTK